jgi:hypothetical protein
LLTNLASFHYKKHLPTFGLANCFACTPPESIPDFDELEGCLFFLPNLFSEFWLAPVTVFGSVYRPSANPNDIYSNTTPPTPITPIGSLLATFNFQHGNSSPATKEADLHSDSGDRLSTVLAKEVVAQYGTWTLAYLNLAEHKRKNRELWTLQVSGLRLTKTNPTLIPGWVGLSLSPSLIADAWVGSQ